MTARGIRNKNPGNLRKSKDKWQGLSAKQTDRDFFVFEHEVYGIRALARVLINYQDKYNRRTIKKIIEHWAPPSENNTAAYIAAVSSAVGVSPTEKLDLHTAAHLKPVVMAIIKHENGSNPYTDAQIDKSLVLAGVEVKKPTIRSKAVSGATIATTGTAGSVAIQIISDAQTAISPLTDYLDFAKYIMLFLILVGIGLTIYAKWDDVRRLGA